VERRADGGDQSALDWAARVQRLEAEVDGLRRAMRSRAVIEQAKGFLSAALNCGLDEAFGHLARLSQYENLRVAEVAARIIGTALPSEPEQPEPGQAETPPFDPLTYLRGPATESDEPADPVGDPVDAPDLPALPAEIRVRLQTAAGAIQSAQTLGSLADRLLDEGASWLDAHAVMIWTSEPDGALRLAASAGVPPQVASDWQRVPSAIPVPVRDAIARDEPIWLDGHQPSPYLVMPDGAACASLPLPHDGRPYAGLVFLWKDPRDLPETERRYLTGLAVLTGRRYQRLAGTGAGGTAPVHWLQGILDALPVAAFLLAPVRDEHGEIIDFVIDHASPLSGEIDEQIPAELIGRRLLDIRPHLATSGVFDAYRQVAVSGGSWQRPPETEVILVGGIPEQHLISRSAVRLGEGLLVAWRTHDGEVELARAAEAEELGGLGYAEWSWPKGAVHWSRGMYRIFDRSPQRGPLTLEQLPEHLVPEDLPILQSELRVLLETREPVDMSFRVRSGGGARLVRAVFRPVLGPGGALTALYGLVQDLTEFQRRNEALRRSEHAAKLRRMHGAVSPRREL